MTSETTTAVNLVEYQEVARAHLPSMSYDYIAGGAGDEATLTANRRSFENWRLVPRVLTGLKEVDLTTTVLGHDVSMPVLIAPVAYHRLAHDDGEVATATQADSAGITFTLSTLSTRSIEDIGQVASNWWFQLYCFSDRAITVDLVRRAEAAGAKAIIVTVDTPKLGRREADERNRFTLPEGLSMVNVMKSVQAILPTPSEGSGLAAYASAMLHSCLTWDDMEWIASQTTLPVGVKGLLAPEDAALAVEHGMRVVVVSNHGGRQLDHSVATLDALPEVVDAVEGRCEVIMDGGVRRGTDIIKALALGAKAVMIGRPVVWGLAADGPAGVARVLELLRAELELDMLLCGCGSTAQVTRRLLRRA
jgi:4-hydroxymandelate oxidase